MFHIAVEHFTDGRRLHFNKWRMIFFKFSESSTSRSTTILHIVRKRNGPKIRSYFTKFKFSSAGDNPRQVGLNLHNDYRRVHNAPIMSLNSQLNDDAQRYAEKLARESVFEHDKNNRNQGENLGLQCASGSDADLVKKVVDAW